jgi:hypothetical protein
MKREVIAFATPIKIRAHRVLFDNDLPFKPKVVKSKLLFKRQQKHKKSCYENDN